MQPEGMSCIPAPTVGSAQVIDVPGSRRAGRLLCGPDGSAREGTVSTPPAPAGHEVPAPDELPSDARARETDGLASKVDRARRMVPEGTFAVGAGLAISGVTAYGFQILAFRGLSKPNSAA